jgi:hypothetical protein
MLFMSHWPLSVLDLSMHSNKCLDVIQITNRQHLGYVKHVEMRDS